MNIYIYIYSHRIYIYIYTHRKIRQNMDRQRGKKGCSPVSTLI